MNATQILELANAGPDDHPLGKEHDEYGTIVAFGSVNAEVDDVEYERLCVLTLLPPEQRVPNERNYAVFYEYVNELPPTDSHGTAPCPLREFVEFFPNIVPAVQLYSDSGMDY